MATAVFTFEYVAFEVETMLNPNGNASHDGLHDPAERAPALSKHDVKMVRHHRKGQQPSVGRCNSFLDNLDDRVAKISILEPGFLTVRASGNMKSRAR